MRIYATTKDRLIRDDFEMKDILSKYVQLVLESQVPVSLNLDNRPILLSYVETLLGPTVVGFVDQETSLELVQVYLNNILLQSHTYPSFMIELASLVEKWKGKIVAGLLSAQEDAIRLNCRTKLGTIASQIINIGSKDLYIFPAEHIYIHTDAKLAMSDSSSKALDAIRKAFVVDRYADFKGLCSYRNLQDAELCVKLDEEDVSLIHARVVSQDLKEFAERTGLALDEAYKVERSLEEKYWLFFNIGIECYLYAIGLKNRQGKVQE
ncbi:MAG TPA: DUF4940 domain-containing protein [Pseudothermotoga sp.]|nr:DUF4940 domain-containing protein [Pseudothermotoga sp.]